MSLYPPTCLSQAQNLGKIDNYRWTLHFITGLEIPCFFYGAYCILFKTPIKMKPVKWILLCLHVISAFTDFMISFISIPYVLFPTISGFALGVVDSPRVQLFAITTGLTAVAVSILTVFENRFYLLFGEKSWWKWARKPFLMVNYVFPLVYFIPPFLEIPDQQEGFKKVVETLPCTPSWLIENRQIFIFSTHSITPILCAITSTITLTTEIIVFFLILSIKIFHQDRQQCMQSRKTHDMQKKFAIALTFQTLLPFMILTVPIICMVFSIYFNYYNQSINNLFCCCLSCHGIASTVVMILVHKPYRDAFFQPFQKCSKISELSQKQPKVSATNEEASNYVCNQKI